MRSLVLAVSAALTAAGWAGLVMLALQNHVIIIVR